MAESPSGGTAPDCGLYIRIGRDQDFETLLAQLRDIFFVAKLSRYDRNMHVLEFPDTVGNAEKAEEIKGLISYARGSGFVALLRGSAALAREWGADGVLLDDVSHLSGARDVLGADAIVGLRCGQSRDLAEQAQAAGADYVSFHCANPAVLLPPDIVAWWSTRYETPVLAEGPVTNDICAAYVAAGATFIDSTRFIFAHPQGAKQGAADMMFAMDLALDKRRPN